MSDFSVPNDDVSSAVAGMTAVVSKMLSQRETYLSRARAWISSPAFEEVYQDLHGGLLFKAFLTLKGKGPAMKMHSARLRSDYARLAREGELLFAGVVIANKGFFSDDKDFRYPMAIVASRSQEIESVVQIAVLADLMADAYMEGGSETMPQCARIIANDRYRALRRQVLPVEETMGLQAAMFDVRVSMNELVGDWEPSVFVPLLVHLGGGPFAVVPWPILHGKTVPAKKSLPPPLPQTPSSPRQGPPPLPGAKPESSAGGSNVLRHQAKPREIEFVLSGPDSGAVASHIEQHVGPVSQVFHELISDRVHLDVHFSPPTPERPFYTLVTCGMSDRPMTVPQGAEAFRYAELMLCLPPSWKLPQTQAAEATPSDFPDEQNDWPVRWLKQLARLPHDYETWLCATHSIPNGDPAEPVVAGSQFTGFMICPAMMVPQGFHRLEVTASKVVNFYAVVPLTTAEMNFKLEKGSDALLARFRENGVTELLAPWRRSVV